MISNTGEIRGPFRTSTGNPLPWMAYCRSPGGWVNFHAKTAQAAMRAANNFRLEMNHAKVN